MAPFPPPPADVLLGWLHGLGLAVLLGATALAWTLHRTDRLELPPAAAIQLAATYETVFWAGAGLLVVADLGRVGGALEAGRVAGLTLGGYFVVVFLLLAGSLVRTFGVAELRRGSLPDPPTATLGRLRRSYVVTAALLVVIALLAEVVGGG